MLNHPGYGHYRNIYDDGVGEVSLHKYDYIFTNLDENYETMEESIDYKIDRELAAQREYYAIRQGEKL